MIDCRRQNPLIANADRQTANLIGRTKHVPDWTGPALSTQYSDSGAAVKRANPRTGGVHPLLLLLPPSHVRK
jgi:hypothetical protein